MKNIRTLLSLLVIILAISAFSSPCIAEELPNPPLPSENQGNSKIYILEKKIDSLSSQENQNIKESAQNTINTANTLIQVITLIFGAVAVLGTIVGIMFRSQIKMIEERARASAINMEYIVANARKMEEAISKRKDQIDKYIEYTDKTMKEIEDKLSAIKSSETDPKEKENKLSEIEKEVTQIKRKIAQAEPYTWSLSPSASMYTTTTTIPYVTTMGSANATVPYYPRFNDQVLYPINTQPTYTSTSSYAQKDEKPVK